MRAGTLTTEGFRLADGLLAFARTQPTEVGAGLLLRDSTSGTSSSDALSATVILAHAVYMVRPRRRRASHALSAMRLASSQLLPAQQLTERRCAHLCNETESA